MKASHFILAALVAFATFFSLHAAARHAAWSRGPAGYYRHRFGRPYFFGGPAACGGPEAGGPAGAGRTVGPAPAAQPQSSAPTVPPTNPAR